ncbi:MAG: aldo/keto reductase [Solirubrobacterales bacterium]|nr:aldo/keto reductase [Solirubrobacterales bacterium]
MQRRRLGPSELHVSRLSLGSWRTFERIDRSGGLAVMQAAREHGINFLDDARYDDETARAPIPTGYSEVVFGELFRAAGWDRADTVVANKLWWEFWPEQTAQKELEASLGRMGFDYVDLIYANPPPDGMPVRDVVAAIGELLRAGLARAWGIVNWEAEQFLAASRAAAEHGLPQPCAAQLPYSLVRRDWVESTAMGEALAASGAGVVASFAIAGGVLTGKYDAGGTGRSREELDDPRLADARETGRRLRALGEDLGVSPAALAIGFALANPAVVSVLFGATSPAQVTENARALELDAGVLERLRAF